MENKSIRIRTTPGVDKNISFELKQDFDFIEILSLKITQQDVYESFCADYGVVVGRVISNEGFGVPNAKVSIFIPVTSEDQKNDLINTLYPYKTVTSVNGEGYRYNLLLEESTCSLNQAVGTFPTKETLLNNEIYLEIFDKYYRYTTVTNDAGDYIIFGVPPGQQTVHMDVDISDIGFLSLRPYDLKSQGFADSLFDGKNFKKSTNLDSLAQIKTQNKGVEVVPFWGDEERCNFGITRVDFNIGNDLVANAIFMGSIFTDSDKNYLKKNCGIKRFMGDQTQLITASGQVDILRLEVNDDGDPINISRLPSKEIDENGVYVFTLPLYYDKVVTDEFGNLVKSPDQTKGVPTKGKYRFKLKFNDNSATFKGRKTFRTASLITPSTNSCVRFTDDIDSYATINVETDFHTFEWKQVYTTTQFIRKLKKWNSGRFDFIGLKNCGEFVITPVSLNDDDDEDDTQSEGGNKNLDVPYNVFIKRPFSGLSKRKKVKACFYDTWLNGGCYLPKFQIRTKNNGQYDCCGFGHNNNNYFAIEGNTSYTMNTTSIPNVPVGNPNSWADAIAGGTEMPEGTRCVFMTPKSIPGVLNGANDTEEFVYCKWGSDTRIMNIGSMLMCKEILDTLKDSLSDNVGSVLKPFFKPTGARFCMSTNVENGIRTQNLIPFLSPTTYLDPNDFFPYQNNDMNNLPNNLPSKWGNNLSIWNSDAFLDEQYKDKELKQNHGGCWLKYYCRIDFQPFYGSNGNPVASHCNNTSPVIAPTSGGYLDLTLNRLFGCPKNWNSDLYYASRYDLVYFYFGITAGSTALDKLKKDFFE
jgi:hypothetical protein